MTPDTTQQQETVLQQIAGGAERSIQEGDKLLVDIGGALYGIEATMVVAIIEVDRFFLLPQIASGDKKEFLKGVITRRGEVIVVIDLERLLKIPAASDEKPYRVIIVKRDSVYLGMCIGRRELSFLWKEELANLEFKPIGEPYTAGMIDPSGKKIRLLDWQEIFKDTQVNLGIGEVKS